MTDVETAAALGIATVFLLVVAMLFSWWLVFGRPA